MWIKVNNNQNFPTGLEFSDFKVFDQKDVFKKIGTVKFIKLLNTKQGSNS